MTGTADLLTDEAVARVLRWLDAAGHRTSRRERVASRRLAGIVTDEAATIFAMRFVDRVIRPESPAVAAHQLASLVDEAPLPVFLSVLDRVLLRAGARLGRWLPRLVMPIALRRMRSLVGHLVIDAQPDRLAGHLRDRTHDVSRSM